MNYYRASMQSQRGYISPQQASTNTIMLFSDRPSAFMCSSEYRKQEMMAVWLKLTLPPGDQQKACHLLNCGCSTSSRTGCVPLGGYTGDGWGPNKGARLHHLVTVEGSASCSSRLCILMMMYSPQVDQADTRPVLYFPFINHMTIYRPWCQPEKCSIVFYYRLTDIFISG